MNILRRRVQLWKAMMSSIAIALIIGCASKHQELYTPNPPESQGNATKLRIAVVEFEDQSPSDVDHGIGIHWLPGVMYGKNYTHYAPTTYSKFGSCFTSELRASDSFSEVTYFPTWGIGTATFAEYDIIVTGRLLWDKRESYWLTYGLTPVLAAIFVAFTQAPMLSEDREVSLEVWASLTKTPGQYILSKAVAFNEPSRWVGAVEGRGIGW